MSSASASGSRSSVTLLAAGAAAVATAAVGYIPQLQERVITAPSSCIVYRVTGWQCPVCGLSHATVALLHGDLGGALATNALAVVYVALLVATLAYGLVVYRRRRRWVAPAVPTPAAMWGLVAVAVYAVARNAA